MEEQNLNQSMRSLRDELRQAETDDAHQEALIRELIEDIDAYLDEESGPDTVEPDVTERLEMAVENFEASHPRLTTFLNKVLDTLSNLGI